MSVKVRYDDDHRMILENLSCDCPCDHARPNQDIYVGKGLIPRLPEYIARRGLGTHCVVVCDENTYKVAGEQVYQVLKNAGYDAILLKFVREGELVPDERTIGELLLTIQPETEFLVAVGSGSITDTCRVNAARCKLPFVSVGTAPSMDGYTSVVAPLILRGTKIHRAGPCPEIIVCDLQVLATAPLDMVRSGVGDVLGKYIAIADWQIGSVINDEPYCPTCGQIVTDAVNKLIDNVDEIKSRSDKGMKILIEALLLAGMTIMIIGNTRAVASVEHNIAHYWEMMQLIHGHKPPQHGASVGVATLLVWPLFTRFAKEDLSRLDLEKIKANRISRENRVKWMLYAYEEEAATSIMGDNEGDFLPWEEQERRIRRAQERFAEIKACIDDLPPFEKVYGTMARLGAQLTAADCGVDQHLLNVSMYCAKDYRTRYTLFKTLDECGLLDEYLKDYPKDWEK